MKKLLALITIIINSLQLLSQDFHLSQYDAASLNVNPAMTGLFKGEYRIHGHYRTQWMAVATKPFTTGLVSFDVNKNKWGYGGQIANFRAGAGSFNVVSFLPSASYRFSFGERKFSFISFGVQAGFFQKSINESALTFASQYVKTDGGQFNTSLSSNEALVNNGLWNLDVNAGLMYYFADPSSMINPFGGVSFYHLNNPNESFLGETNVLKIRTQGIVGARVAVTPIVTIMPKIFFQYEEKATELTYSAQGQFYLSKQDIFLLGGLTYRNKDAAIIELGAKYGNFTGRLSYDINTSSLLEVSNGRGGTEFSLTYIFSTPNPNPVPTCPRL